MSLIHCANCGTIDNTATGLSKTGRQKAFDWLDLELRPPMKITFLFAIHIKLLKVRASLKIWQCVQHIVAQTNLSAT